MTFLSGRSFRAATPVRMVGGALLTAFLAFALSLLAGCGGSSGGHSVGTGSLTTTRQTATVGITLPALPSAAGTRLIPSNAKSYKVEFLDTDGNGNNVAIPVYVYGPAEPKTVEVPSISPYGGGLYDLVFAGNPPAGITRYYGQLPVKNLILRISTYDTPDGVGVALSVGETLIHPQPFNADGTFPVVANVTLSLNTNIDHLTLTSSVTAGDPNTVTSGGNGVTYTLVAFAADGSLVPLDPAKTTWKVDTTSYSGSGSPVTPITQASGTSLRLSASGNLTGSVLATATDGNSGKTVSQAVTVAVASGAITVQGGASTVAPPGTRSIQVRVDDTGVTATDAAKQQPIGAPVIATQAWTSGAFPTIDFSNSLLPISPGVRRVRVQCFSGANATGVVLSTQTLLTPSIPPGSYATKSGPVVSLSPFAMPTYDISPKTFTAGTAYNIVLTATVPALDPATGDVNTAVPAVTQNLDNSLFTGTVTKGSETGTSAGTILALPASTTLYQITLLAAPQQTDFITFTDTADKESAPSSLKRANPQLTVTVKGSTGGTVGTVTIQ